MQVLVLCFFTEKSQNMFIKMLAWYTDVNNIIGKFNERSFGAVNRLFYSPSVSKVVLSEAQLHILRDAVAAR